MIDRFQQFRALHQRSGIFVMPNAWDAGSAKMLYSMGFAAIASTSAGLANSLGRPDGEGLLSAEETLRNAAELVQAVPLPVSADMENGYGDEPEDCAKMIERAAAIGLAGGSIEDATGRGADPIYPLGLAVERVAAAVRAAKVLERPFVLTARAENLIHGRQDMADTIRRLQAFAAAGAEVLFAPGLESAEQIALVVKEVAPAPLSVVMGLGNSRFTVAQLEDLGVKRISLGSSLARAAYTAFYKAAAEVKEMGSFTFAAQNISYGDLNRMLR